MAGLMLFAGWFHYHKKAPKLEWFQNVESMMNHHLAGLLGCGCLGYAGQQIHVGPAKHSFGNVQASFIAYAKKQQPHCPLKAGTVITTGSLCGLVPTSGTGHVVGRIGNHTVELDIV